MKKILIALVAITLGHFANAQRVKNSIPSGNPEVTTADPASNVNPDYVNTKAVRSFKKAFKNVSDAKWYEMPDGYRANFTLNDVRYRLDFDKNGNWLHTVSYYNDKKLPTEVRRLVVSSYLDYTITLVEEIETPGSNKSYIIHLEGQTNWINIKVFDQEITELAKINKA